MTVSSSTNRVSYAGNGSTTVFPYTYKIFDQDDLTVILRAANGTETVQTITSQYTVSGVGNAGGGNVTMLTAPASGATLVILREQDLIQELDIVPNDPFPADSLEGALDKLTFMVQQHEETLDRTIKASRTNTIAGAEFTVAAADRANKVFAFDGSGNLSIAQELGIFRGNWAASTAFAERDIIKDTSNSNIYICLVAHTSSGSQPISTNTDVAKWALIVDAAAAATSATNAANSASAAATSETNAANSASAASTSETNAASSASAASTSATNASNSASAAAGSATTASNAATAAGNAQTAAEAAQTAAETAETNAETAETNAETAETNAAASASAASTSETNAASSASAASTSASNAATSATNASNSASAAATSASNASTSETNAANSASAASGSATSAANSAAAAAASFDSFDDRYLGVKASDPTLDNDGNALVAGALYFSSSENIMKVYDGASWIAATSAGNVSFLQYEYTATLGQTTFSGADDNAATLSYTVANLIVTLNGVVLDNGGDYTATNGTSVVLTSGAAAGDLLQVIAFKSFTVADMVPASTGGTFSGNVAVNGNLTVDTDTLFVDAANNRVGMGTSSPDRKLTLSVSPGSATDDGVKVVEGSNTAVLARTGSAYSYRGVGASSTLLYSNNTLSFLADGSSNMTFHNGGNERMRIDSSGTLGLGVTPSAWNTAFDGRFQFGVQGVLASTSTSSQIGLNWYYDGAYRYIGTGEASRFYQLGGGFFFENAASGTAGNAITFAERMRIDASGNLLVGTTSQSFSNTQMTVYQDVAVGNAIEGNFDGNGGIGYLGVYRGSSGIANFGYFIYNGVSNVGSITSTGSSTSYNTSSDYRLKENVVPLAGAADRLAQIPVHRFNFIADPDTTVDGFLAHEVQAFVPECVTGEKDEVDDEGNPKYQGIDQSKLVPLLTAALQEALARIETLEADVAALKGEPA
jgi:hypothetical protein